jgi:hypothetical protein
MPGNNYLYDYKTEVAGMTEAQIIAALGAENMDDYVSIPGLRYIGFKKDKNVVRSDIRDVRLKFDTTNDILEVVYVRPFSQSESYPPHGNYDEMDLEGVSTVFEYLTEFNGTDVIKDYYSFDSITVLGFNSLE